MKRLIYLLTSFLFCSISLHAQNFFLETSMPKTAGINAGARFVAYNDINEYISLGVMGRLHRFSMSNNGSDNNSGNVVNTIEPGVGGGFKINFIPGSDFEVYAFPNAEISSFRRDVGASAGLNFGVSKEIVFPFTFNFEIGSRYRALLWDDPIALDNRFNLFISAGIGLKLLNSYNGPGPVLLNKARPKRKKIRY